MNLETARRLASIKTSPTLAITAKAMALKAAGKDIISLAAGEPDFATPDHIKQAAVAAIDANFSHYTEVDGIPELKAAISSKLSKDNNLQYTAEQLLVSCGAKHSIFNLLQAVLNPGDEVIIPAPYWVSYLDMVMLCEAKPVIVDSSITQRFKCQPEALEAAISPKTRMVMLNSPNNPSGVAYTQAELQALGAVLSKHPDIIVMSDDIYEHNYWADFAFSNIVTACPELYERAVVINGVSKAYAMTGWRIGYAAGPSQLIKAMRKIQSHSTSNPCSIAQKAATAALSGSQECVKQMSAEFRRRHDYFYTELSKLAGLNCIPADGAFYVFMDASGLIEKLSSQGVSNDLELSSYLIEHAGVATVPGSAFGCADFLRASVATSMANLEQAISRIAKVAALA